MSNIKGSLNMVLKMVVILFSLLGEAVPQQGYRVTYTAPGMQRKGS